MKLEIFLYKILNEFEKKNISYCVLRNYESFPKKWLADDIDILINKKDLKLITKIIKKYSDIIYYYQRYYLCAFALNNITRPNKNYFKIDFVTKLSWKGLSYLDCETVFKNKIRYKNKFFIPKKCHETLITLFTSYLVGGWVNKKYQNKIRNNFIKDNKNIFNALELKFSKHIIHLLSKNIINNNKKKLLKILNKIKIDLMLFYIKNNLFLLLNEMARYATHEIRIKFSSHLITRIKFIYTKQNFQNKTRKYVINNIKNFFAFSINYKKKNFMKNFFSMFLNPYKEPLLIVDEVTELDDKKNKFLSDFTSPNYKVRINSINLKDLLIKKNKIIKLLKFKAKKKINNEIY